MQKRLIIGLAVSLGASLLVIAFLAGRLTTPVPVVVGHESQPAPAEPSIGAGQPDPPTAEVQHAKPALQPEDLVHDSPPHEPERSTTEVIRAVPPPRASAVTSYFAKIDAIQSAGSGDPMTFAQGIVGGLQSGDTSGLDSLVNNATLALAAATTVQPPPECAEYHRRLLESLSESVAGMEKIRSALKKGDVGDLSVLAAQFQGTQQKVDDLDRMKKQLIGR